MIAEIVEVDRLAAAGVEPLGIAHDGSTLWVCARESYRIYAVDPVAFAVRAEYEAPGAPFGAAIEGEGLPVSIGFGHGSFHESPSRAKEKTS